MIFPAPTPQLVLRAWREEDLGTFTAMNADPRVMEYFPAPLAPEQSAEFMERIREEFSTEGFGLYAVERREDGECAEASAAAPPTAATSLLATSSSEG